MSLSRRPLLGKKLLVASLGVGMLNLTDCSKFTTGNLAPPLPCDAGGYCEPQVDLSPAPDLGSADFSNKD